MTAATIARKLRKKDASKTESPEDGEITDESSSETVPGTPATSTTAPPTTSTTSTTSSGEPSRLRKLSAASSTASTSHSSPLTPPAEISSPVEKLVMVVDNPADVVEAKTTESSEQKTQTVKPELSLEELEAAKSVVLDLLGWGVSPEYLVDCGVSSPAIYKIFTDLHLRLPSNLASW